MSKHVDEIVVSMQFDNKNFEKNIASTMRTLDEFKRKMDLKGASKGLEDVDKAARKVDMKSLGNGVESVQAKFSAMQVVGVTALANITNSAVNAGKKIVSALTIDPIKTGFQEYETQIGAVQTILANTQSKGSTLDDVNKALEELNKYADQTIYNFTEMTRNIGTFTAAGVELDTSVSSIKGIANLAAISGSTSQQASTAMYQLSQALAAGKVSLMDWNSVVNAGMGGQIFQDALKRTSQILGTGAEAAIAEHGSFRESLSKSGWLTTEVLTETLNQFTMAAEEGTAEWEAYKASLKEKGYTEEQAVEILKMANTATDAATKVKTFTQMWDVLKEAAQSGWSQSWKIIVGDFEEAKALFTPVTDFLTGIINKMSDFRNRILEAVLGNPFADFLRKLNDAGFGTIKKMIDGTNKLIGSLEYYQDVVNRVWRGDYNNRGDNPDRYFLLTGEGYNPRVVQELVNKGYKYKLTMEDVIAAQNKYGASTAESAKMIEEMSISLEDLTDEQLENAGFTQEEIKIFRLLAEEAKNAGKSMQEYMEEMSSMDGRTRLIETFKNIGTGLMNVFKTIGQAWSETFPFDETALIFKLAIAIKNLYDWSVKFAEGLKLTNDETGEASKKIENIKRTFKGLFAALDIVLTLVGGPLRIAFKILGQLLSVFHLDVWSITAVIGDAIVGFRDWIDSVLDFTAIFEKIKPHVTEAIDSIVAWVEATKPLEKVGAFFADMFDGIKKWVASSEELQKAGEFFKNAFSGIGEWFSGIKEAENIPKYIIQGLVNGLSQGIKVVLNAAMAIGKGIIEKVKEVLGIHSPSTEFIEIGKNIMAGLIVGIGSIKLLSVVSTITGALSGVGEVLEGVGSVLAGTGRVLWKSAVGIGRIFKRTARVIGAAGNLMNAKALQTLAISIAILAGSVVVLSMLDQGKAWSATGMIAALAGVLIGLMAAIKAFGITGPKGIKEAITGVKAFGLLASSLLAISGSLLLLAISLRIIGGMDWGELGVAAAGVGLFAALITGLIFATKFGGAHLAVMGAAIQAIGGAMLMLSVALRIIGGMDWSELGVAAAGITLLGLVISGLIWSTKLAGPFAAVIGSTILAISGAMLMLSVALRIIGGMKWEKLGTATVGMALLTGVIVLLIHAVKLAGPNVAAIGATILAISGAMAILTITAQIIAGMEWDAMGKAAIGLAGLVLIIRMMIQAVKLAGPNVAAIGATLLAVSTAMFMLTVIAKIIGGMECDEINKAAIGLAGLVLIIRMMLQAVKLAGPNPVKIAGTLLALSASLGILAGIAVLLSLVEIKALAKGVVAVGLLGGVMTAMIWATRGASDCKANLIVMSVAIGIMAAAVAALSFIDPTKLAGATIAMGAVMAMFAVMMLASKSAVGSMGSLIVMTVVIGLMAGVLYLLAQLPVEASIGTAAALSLLMISLSACLVILSAVGVYALLAIVGVVALTTMVIPMSAFVNILAKMQDIQNAEQNAVILTKLMVTMTACLLAVSLVAPLAILAVVAITSMVGVITAVGVLMTAIGALVTKFPQLETFLDKGIPILEKIGYAIGSVFGNIVAGFAISALSSLPMVGLLLSQFMMNALPFIAGAKLIDPATMDGVKSLAEVILILTGASILDGLTSWLTGGSSITKFGEDISKLGPYLKTFADSVAGINVESVQAAANAAKALAEMTAAIPNEGGVAGWFMGENSIIKFAADLPVLGLGLKMFSDSVAGINTENITAASEAAKTIADMTSSIPNEGGVAAWFAGENSISKFAEDLPDLGLGLKGFSDNVAGINADNINAAVKAAEAICEMSNNIPNEGGMVSWFTGDNSIAKFGSQLGEFGTAIATFSTNVGEASVDNINKAVSATKSLSDLLSTKVSKSTDVMEKFGKKLVDFGKKVSEFCDKMGGVSDAAISAAADKLNKLVNMASTLNSDNISSMAKFSDTLSKVAKNGVKEFVSALNDKSVKTDANEAISDLVSSTANGIKTVTNKDKFKSAGKYLIGGLAEGIRNNKSTATKAAQEVADAVESIIRSAWEINSPSKVFYRIALGIGEGIEYALGDSTSGVKSSARDLADTTSKGFGNAISKINDMFDGTFDAQPTIRPVLDLSDVQAGANSIAGMFSGNRTLAISAPGIGAISASMSSRQIGNNDLVSAINKLAKSNGKSGNTYQINGINYNEGSDVADAIQTLVRATKMEGRT